MEMDGVHQINCVLSSQELYELVQNPPGDCQPSSFVWEEAWWCALETELLTHFDSAFFSSGGVLEGIVSSVLREHPSASVQ